MSRYAQARAELEQALVIPERRSIEASEEPARYGAITVMQPWAWLIAHASDWPAHVQGKTIENRSQPTGYRGLVLIHVSRTWDRVGEQLAELRRLGLVGSGCPEPNLGVMRSQLGLVIAVGELTGCRRVTLSDPHPWACGTGWGWELAEVQLVQPFPLSGQRGLWFTQPGLEVRRCSGRLLLEDLPFPHGRDRTGLRYDPTLGTASIEVSSFNEAIKVLKRLGLWRLDYMLRVNRAATSTRMLWSKAAAEVGDREFSRRLLEPTWPGGLARDQEPELAARGPQLHGCERGRRG